MFFRSLVYRYLDEECALSQVERLALDKAFSSIINDRTINSNPPHSLLYSSTPLSSQQRSSRRPPLTPKVNSRHLSPSTRYASPRSAPCTNSVRPFRTANTNENGMIIQSFISRRTDNHLYRANIISTPILT